MLCYVNDRTWETHSKCRKKSAPFHLHRTHLLRIDGNSLTILKRISHYMFLKSTLQHIIPPLNWHFYAANGFAIPSLLIDLHQWRYKKNNRTQWKKSWLLSSHSGFSWFWLGQIPCSFSNKMESYVIHYAQLLVSRGDGGGDDSGSGIPNRIESNGKWTLLYVHHWTNSWKLEIFAFSSLWRPPMRVSATGF